MSAPEIPKDWRGSYWEAWQAGRVYGQHEAYHRPLWWIVLKTRIKVILP